MRSPEASRPPRPRGRRFPRRSALGAAPAAVVLAAALAALVLAAPGGAGAGVGPGVGPGVGQTAAETAALDAWMKLLGLLGGAAAEPVTLTEDEASLLLATPPAAPILAEEAGLSSVSTRFGPGEVRFSASADPEALAALLPLPLPLGGAAVPLRATVRLVGEDGLGRATLVEASAGGLPVPPEAVAEALLERLLAAFSVVEGSPEVEGATARFPLPAGLRALEVGPGEVRLTPGG